MDAMIGFEYKHNNMIKLDTSLGAIELTYKTREGQKEEFDSLAGLFAEMPAEPVYDEPARNEYSFFRAVLLTGDNKIRFVAYGVVPDEAIKALYRREAVDRMEAEFYPKPYNY